MPDLEALLQNVTELTPFSLALVAFVGLVVGIAPGSFPLLSVGAGLAAGTVVANSKRRRADGLSLSIAFALGIATMDAIVGALFGVAGFAVMRVLARFLDAAYAVLGLILVITGLALLRVVHITIPVLNPTAKTTRSFARSFLLGLPFGLSTCPACTPLLLPVVLAAASTADPVTGAGLMFVFGLARGVPLVAVGTAAGALAALRTTRVFVRRIERAGAILLLGAAVYFFHQAARFAGWLAP